jgi:hypothetical protein
MPTNRTFCRRRRRPEAFDHHREMHLCRGYSFLAGSGYGASLTDDLSDDHPEMRGDWQEHDHDITQRHIVEFPGTRPWGWWRFDAPERRRRSDGKPHPFDDRGRVERARHAGRPDRVRLCFGIPASMFTADCFEARYETQLEYLKRLNLLQPGELDRALAADIREDHPTLTPGMDSAEKSNV